MNWLSKCSAEAVGTALRVVAPELGGCPATVPVPDPAARAVPGRPAPPLRAPALRGWNPASGPPHTAGVGRVWPRASACSVSTPRRQSPIPARGSVRPARRPEIARTCSAGRTNQQVIPRPPQPAGHPQTTAARRSSPDHRSPQVIPRPPQPAGHPQTTPPRPPRRDHLPAAAPWPPKMIMMDVKKVPKYAVNVAYIPGRAHSLSAYHGHIGSRGGLAGHACRSVARLRPHPATASNRSPCAANATQAAAC